MLPFCLTESQTAEQGHVGGALTCVDAAWDDRSLFSSRGRVPVTPTNCCMEWHYKSFLLLCFRNNSSWIYRGCCQWELLLCPPADLCLLLSFDPSSPTCHILTLTFIFGLSFSVSSPCPERTNFPPLVPGYSPHAQTPCRHFIQSSALSHYSFSSCPGQDGSTLLPPCIPQQASLPWLFSFCNIYRYPFFSLWPDPAVAQAHTEICN